MNRLQPITDETPSAGPHPALIQGLFDELVIIYILPYLLPRELGALTCVNRHWKRIVPWDGPVCYANALVPRATRYPSVFGYDGLGTFAVLLQEELFAARKNRDLLWFTKSLRRDLKQFVFPNVGGCETYHDEDMREMDLPKCYTCGDPIREESYACLFSDFKIARGGREVHHLDMAFHSDDLCSSTKDIARCLYGRILTLVRRIYVHRYRIHRPRGYGMTLEKFKALVNQTATLSTLTSTVLGPDAREQEALWNLYEEYPPPPPSPTAAVTC